VSGAILIRNLEFQARHGATAAERKLLRRFQVDIELLLPLGAAAKSDRLGDTVDYSQICALAVELGTNQTFHLIEALAGALVEAIAERCPQAGITVEVRKLNPPCPGNPAYTAARLSRPAPTSH
jgi:dihydroneopterin aldolase